MRLTRDSYACGSLDEWQTLAAARMDRAQPATRGLTSCEEIGRGTRGRVLGFAGEALMTQLAITLPGRAEASFWVPSYALIPVSPRPGR